MKIKWWVKCVNNDFIKNDIYVLVYIKFVVDGFVVVLC